MTHWLVKDFHVLYRAAKQALEHVQREGYASAELVALQVHVNRLAPAYQVCESERHSGTPERLTPGERYALNALHRWLHSPLGDDALIEDAQAYHEQLHGEAPEECTRLEEDERIAWANAARGQGVEVREATEEEQRAEIDAAAAEYIEDMATAEPRKEPR